MSSTHTLIGLLGAIALLLWGIRLVHKGVMTAFGSSLRHALSTRLKNRLTAMLAGIAVTAALQSSTATAMMVASFAASGLVAVVPALAVMLGANVGTALIVQALSFDISLVFPLLLFAGYVLQRQSGARIVEIGRICLGLGVILLSLTSLGEIMTPLEHAPKFREVVRLIVEDPVLALGLAAVFTWAAHSSVGAILFIMSLAGLGVLSPESTIAMVLGANLGSAINPVLEGSRDNKSRLRVPIGNLVNRIVGCLLVMPFLPLVARLAADLGLPDARLAPDFHLAFNVVMALLTLPLLPLAARALTAWFPDEDAKPSTGRPRYLDQRTVDNPKVALANAAREALHMADVAEAMLRGSSEVFRSNNPARLREVRRTDDTIDGLYVALRRYLAEVSRRELGESEVQRLQEILDFAVNVEHIGDIVDANLMELAEQRIAKRLLLSEASVESILELHERLIANLRLAVSVLMDGDAASARQLVAEKEKFRTIEREANAYQFRQILSGRIEGAETASIYLDVVRDLKRIESHIAATVYPLLERTGDLRKSRLA